MDCSFEPEEKAIADSFRDFLQREVLPKEAELKEGDGNSDDNKDLRQEVMTMRRSSAADIAAQ